MKSIDVLNRHIVACRLCDRLVAHREAMASAKRRQFHDWTYWGRPVTGFGDHRAGLLVLGLAPAAHGGNRTGRVFTGDRSGDWLYAALHRYGFANQASSTHRGDGLHLRDCYVTASVRCAPPGNKPIPAEFDTCRPYLLTELRLLTRVRVVVVLGRIAFEQYLKARHELGYPKPSPAPRFHHGARIRLPGDLVLLCSYHPSQQNTFTGKLTRPMFHAVFREAKRLLKP